MGDLVGAVCYGIDYQVGDPDCAKCGAAIECRRRTFAHYQDTAPRSNEEDLIARIQRKMKARRPDQEDQC